jgi:Fe-S cluster assembly protein SufD
METITKVSIKEKIISEFELNKNSLFGDSTVRKNALDCFSKLGIPGRKSEEYKYVNMELTLKGDFAFSSSLAVTAQQTRLPDGQVEKATIVKNAIVVVIENGVFSAKHSKLGVLPKGLIIQNISDATSLDSFKSHYSNYSDAASDPFVALNTALASGGVFMHVAKSAVIELPIHIIHLNTCAIPTIINARNLVVVEENAQATIVESFVISSDSAKIFNNALSEIVVAANANVKHYKIQDEGDAGNLVNTTQVYQKKQSVFSTNNFTLSGSLVRNNLIIVLDDEHIESHLNGLYLTKGNQVVDNHTLVDHRKPNCNSNELYKGIIDDKSAATFNGKIYVRKDAQKTNAFQSNKNILLSDDGTINTKPQLEIYADDVKCSHGTSTGKLDEDQVFYLRARGLSEASAKKLLMHAFASEVVNTIELEELKNYLEAEISNRFE